MLQMQGNQELRGYLRVSDFATPGDVKRAGVHARILARAGVLPSQSSASCACEPPFAVDGEDASHGGDPPG